MICTLRFIASSDVGITGPAKLDYECYESRLELQRLLYLSAQRPGIVLAKGHVTPLEIIPLSKDQPSDPVNLP